MSGSSTRRKLPTDWASQSDGSEITRPVANLDSQRSSSVPYCVFDGPIYKSSSQNLVPIRLSNPADKMVQWNCSPRPAAIPEMESVSGNEVSEGPRLPLW